MSNRGLDWAWTRGLGGTTPTKGEQGEENYCWGLRRKEQQLLGMNPWGGELLLKIKKNKATTITIARYEQEKKYC
jgi:hypothetical protein